MMPITRSVRRRRLAVWITVALVVPLFAASPASAVDADTTNYRVTVTNTTTGQPFSPPVVATHDPAVSIFTVGEAASDELAAIAQGGDPAPLVTLLQGVGEVTDIHNTARPLTTTGSNAGGFSDSVTFELYGTPGDVLSLAGMLICTNDGFAGVDSVALPASGSVTYDLGSYDAGRENNSEASGDLVDPCSGIGPVGLDGDPDGNIDTGAVLTNPAGVVATHPGITGNADLSVSDHGWTGPVGTVTIEVVPFTYGVFLTNLTTGQPFSPPVAATHDPSVRIFESGEAASDELAAIAQGGDPAPLVTLLDGLTEVTDVVNAGRPLPANGSSVAGFASTLAFSIEASAGDVFSIAGMLICTNDGFAGVDSVALPASGSVSYDVVGYDAGREDNTEASEDLVDPCSGIGPVGLDGDPDGNIDDGDVLTSPTGVVATHPGITGNADLSVSDHGWTGPVARVTIAVLDNTFADDDASGLEAEIDLLAATGITTGTSATAFSPLDNVTRGQMAAFFVRALDLPASSTDAFTDDDGSPFEADINALAAAGITTGTAPGTYSPGDSVTREQMAAFFVRALGIPASSTDAFTDDDGSPFEADINAFAEAGITEGTGPGMFSPADPVLREQMAAFFIRAIDPAG